MVDDIDNNYKMLDASLLDKDGKDKENLIQEMKALNTIYSDKSNNEAMAFIGASLEEYNFNRDQAR